MITNLLGSFLEADAARDAAREDSRTRERMLQQQIDEANRAYGVAQGLYSPYTELTGSALAGLQGFNQDVMGGAYDVPELGEFTYDKTVQDFLDPSMRFQQEQMQRALESSAAAGGGLLSGGALKELQGRSSDLAMRDYGNAFNRQQQAEGSAYSRFLNNANAARERINQMYNTRASSLGSVLGQAQFGAAGTANARLGQGNMIQGNIGAQINPLAQNNALIAAGYGGQIGSALKSMSSPEAMQSYVQLAGGGM